MRFSACHGTTLLLMNTSQIPGLVRPNVKKSERWVSLVLGLGLLAFGRKNRQATSLGAYLVVRGITGFCVFNRLTGRDTSVHEIRLHKRYRVAQPLSLVYQTWQRVELIPQFMRHVESVSALDDRYSRWKTTFHPAEWHVRLLEDVPNERLVFRDTADSPVEFYLELSFAEGRHAGETEVQVTLFYRVRAADEAGISAESSERIANDVRGFGKFMETV